MVHRQLLLKTNTSASTSSSSSSSSNAGSTSSGSTINTNIDLEWLRLYALSSSSRLHLDSPSTSTSSSGGSGSGVSNTTSAGAASGRSSRHKQHNRRTTATTTTTTISTDSASSSPPSSPSSSPIHPYFIIYGKWGVVKGMEPDKKIFPLFKNTTLWDNLTRLKLRGIVLTCDKTLFPTLKASVEVIYSFIRLFVYSYFKYIITYAHLASYITKPIHIITWLLVYEYNPAPIPNFIHTINVFPHPYFILHVTSNATSSFPLPLRYLT